MKKIYCLALILLLASCHPNFKKEVKPATTPKEDLKAKKALIEGQIEEKMFLIGLFDERDSSKYAPRLRIEHRESLLKKYTRAQVEKSIDSLKEEYFKVKDEIDKQDSAPNS